MRSLFPYLLLAYIILLTGSCKYAEYSYLEGKVFTLVSGDTLFLDSVGVDFYNTEKVSGAKAGFGQSQDFHQRVWTTKKGEFRFMFKYAPAESVYELTFRKKGYLFASQKFEIDYEDLDQTIIRNQELKPGEFKDLFYQRHQKEKTFKKDVLFLSIVIGGGIFTFIIFLLMYGDRMNIAIQDFFRNRSKKRNN